MGVSWPLIAKCYDVSLFYIETGTVCLPICPVLPLLHVHGCWCTYVLKRLEAGELQRIKKHLKTKPDVPLDRPEQ